MSLHGTSHSTTSRHETRNSSGQVAFTFHKDTRGNAPRRGTMRHTLLISVAALALAAASTTVTLAQQKPGGAPGASGMSAPAGTNAPAANPSGAGSTGTPGAAQSEPSEQPA